MTNFVTDLTSLAGTKTDWEVHPEIPLGQKLIATEVNDIVQACYDLRGALTLFTSVAKGLVPASGGGTSNFLRADGTWAAPLLGTGLVTLNNAVASNSIAWSGASCTVNLSGASSSIKATGITAYSNLQVNGETLFGATATDIFLYPPSANAGGTRHDINLNASGTGGVVRINSNTGGLALTGTGGLEVYAGNNSATLLGSITSVGVKTKGGRVWSSGAGTPEAAVVGSPGDLFSRTDGGTGTSFYVKETGSATNTGWVAK